MNVREAKAVARQLGVQVQAARRIQDGVYQIRATDGRCFALKAMAYPVTQLRWFDSALQELRKAGFTRVSWRDSSQAEGKRLYVRNRHGTPFVLTPWIKGRLPSPRSRADMMVCGATLAELHRTGVISSAQQEHMNMIGKWPAELRMKHVILQNQITRASSSQSTKRARLFLRKHGHEILGYAQKAQAILRSSQYRHECALAAKQRHICHGDGGPANFVFTSSGPYLIDFETLRVDLRAYDLYRLIFNSCWKQGWNFAIAKSILDGYQAVSKLNSADFELVKVWLRFPRTTELKLNRYYKAKSQEIRASIASGLPAALRAERRVTGFLKQLDGYLDGSMQL